MTNRLGDYEFKSPVPLYYSDLFLPLTFDKYAMRVVLDGPQLKFLSDLVGAVAKEGKVKLNSSPFKTGDEILEARDAAGKETTEDMRVFLANKVVFKATSGIKYPPNLYVPGPGGPVKAQSSDKFFIGALVIPVVSLRPWSTALGSGVNAYFNALFSTGKGDRIGGGGGGPKASWMQFADPEPTGGLWALETSLKNALKNPDHMGLPKAPPLKPKQRQGNELTLLDDEIPF